MTKGVLVFAFNNEQIDYIKQAKDLAARVEKHLGLPTSIVTDAEIESKLFDKIIKFDGSTYLSQKTYHNGRHSVKLSFKNCARILAYDLTPYDETIVLDTDFIICNDIFSQCFDQPEELLMYHRSIDVTGTRPESNEFKWISDTGPKFYWATCVFFRKGKFSKMFFDLLAHIYENYSYYRILYQLKTRVYRNDFAFSIAAHILNNFMDSNIIQEMPGTKYYITDRDELIDIDQDNLLFLSEKSTAIKTKNQNVHCMNKFSLEKTL
jgi:hypothetical protein